MKLRDDTCIYFGGRGRKIRLNATASNTQERNTSPNGRVKLRHPKEEEKRRGKCTSRVIKAGLCQLAICRTTADEREKEKCILCWTE